FCGLGLIFVGLEVMSSEQAFGNPLVESMFTDIFKTIDFPLLLILVGVIFTALLQSSSAATGVVITMVGTGVLPLDLALFIVLGANIGTCVTALLASVGANANSKRVALIHFTFNVIGTLLFTIIIWIFREPVVNLLVSMFPGADPMSLQMRVSFFHVIFNVTTTFLLLPFVKQLVKLSQIVIKDKKEKETSLTLKYVDERLLSMPSIALMQVKKEISYMLDLAKENIGICFVAMETGSNEHNKKLVENEKIIDYTNNSLTKFLIKLSATRIKESSEGVIGSYFHVLNDIERIGDHAENFHEIGIEMKEKGLNFSSIAIAEISQMKQNVNEMFKIAENAFKSLDTSALPMLSQLENEIDAQESTLKANHFNRLATEKCNVELSPYYSSTITGLERVADHLVNIGYSIVSPVGSQN
ncbi:MAG: Na/Pi cotransporter family protein, partial [Clostridia bacterium]|nr:Na/Pi cotransporter family protein [Clostridia bacterium]